jgi:hypothetical protein
MHFESPDKSEEGEMAKRALLKIRQFSLKMDECWKLLDMCRELCPGIEYTETG